MSESIRQEVSIAASPERVFKVLTDGHQFSAATGGAPASIDPTEGGAFSCFGGMILGRNIEIVPAQRLVQAWRVKTWDAGLFSVARFELSPKGAGTLITFEHTGFPAGDRDHLTSGWHANYWEPIKKYLEQR